MLFSLTITTNKYILVACDFGEADFTQHIFNGK